MTSQTLTLEKYSLAMPLEADNDEEFSSMSRREMQDGCYWHGCKSLLE